MFHELKARCLVTETMNQQQSKPNDS